MTQDRPKRPPRWPKTAPRGAQRSPKRPQDRPKTAQERPRAPQEAPRWPKSAPRGSQDGLGFLNFSAPKSSGPGPLDFSNMFSHAWVVLGPLGVAFRSFQEGHGRFGHYHCLLRVETDHRRGETGRPTTSHK